MKYSTAAVKQRGRKTQHEFQLNTEYHVNIARRMATLKVGEFILTMRRCPTERLVFNYCVIPERGALTKKVILNRRFNYKTRGYKKLDPLIMTK